MPGLQFPGATTFYPVIKAGGDIHTEPFTNNKPAQWIQLPDTKSPLRYTQFPFGINICDAGLYFFGEVGVHILYGHLNDN